MTNPEPITNDDMQQTDSIKDATTQDLKAVHTKSTSSPTSIVKSTTQHVRPELLQVMTEEELNAASRKLVRKLDLRLMGPLILMYIMNYLDR